MLLKQEKQLPRSRMHALVSFLNTIGLMGAFRNVNFGHHVWCLRGRAKMAAPFGKVFFCTVLGQSLRLVDRPAVGEYVLYTRVNCVRRKT